MFRRSKQKEAILKVLKETTCHPDAEWVYEHVRKEIPNISLGTVYRNLRFLKQANAIQEVCLSSGISHFDGNPDSHYHFRCDRCGQIYNLHEEADMAIEKRVASKTGFKVTRLELGGLCISCQRV